MEPEVVERNLLRHPNTLTTTTLLRLGQVTSSSHATEKGRASTSSSSCNQLYQSSRRHPRTYILTYFFQKTIIHKNFWALFEGPRCSTPTFSNPSPRATYPRIFFPPLQLNFNKRFYSGTPNLQRHPPPTPYSHSPPRVTYPTIFSASLHPF